MSGRRLVGVMWEGTGRLLVGRCQGGVNSSIPAQTIGKIIPEIYRAISAVLKDHLNVNYMYVNVQSMHIDNS